MEKLYHCTHLDLPVGSIIEPGNWGKIVNQIGEKHPSWNREATLEKVRASYFPSKPSRFNSTFCCDSLEAAHFYRAKNISAGFIYEVELTNKSASMHTGDFNAVEPLPRLDLNMEQIAFAYWKFEVKTQIEGWQIECNEIVSASSLKVIKKIDPSTYIQL